MQLVRALGSIALVVSGCDAGDGGTGDADTPGGDCSARATGTFPGVTVAIQGEQCRIARGHAATFTYSITVDASARPAIGASSNGGCGSCSLRDADPRTWSGWNIGGVSSTGTSQQFCECDVGCCAPDEEHSVTLTTGTFTDTIEWSGKTWAGPSDTGTPMGDYFEAGDYDVQVDFADRDSSVAALLPITVTP